MATRDTTQLAQPVPVQSDLATPWPSPPEKLSKAFTDFAEWHGEVSRIYQQIQQAFSEVHTGIALPIAALANQGNNNTSAITRLTQTVTSGDTTLAAAISNEATVRATADGALSTTLSSVSAVASSKVKTYVQGSAPIGTLTDGDIWIDTASGNALKRWNGTIWIDTTVSSGIIASAVSTETTARVSADNALASSITSLTAIVSSNTAAISTESTARATANTAISATVTSLTATVSANTAAISSEATTRASADTAISATITALTSTVSANTAAITAESVTRASADTAISGTITTLTATVSSKITSFRQPTTPTPVSTGDMWIDTANGNAVKWWSGTAWVDTTVASGAISAAVTTESTARASADTALSTSITTLTSTVSGNTAAITAESTARAAADGNLASKYTLTVTAGNVVTGLNLTSTSGPGTSSSNVVFQAANFQIYDGSSSGLPIFDISGGIVRLGGTLKVDQANTKVYIGTGTYGNVNTAWYVDQAGNFSLKDNLTWDGTALTIKTSGNVQTIGSIVNTDSAAYVTFQGGTGYSQGIYIQRLGLPALRMLGVNAGVSSGGNDGCQISGGMAGGTYGALTAANGGTGLVSISGDVYDGANWTKVATLRAGIITDKSMPYYFMQANSGTAPVAIIANYDGKVYVSNAIDPIRAISGSDPHITTPYANFYCSSHGVLKTDSAFVAGSDLTVSGIFKGDAALDTAHFFIAGPNAGSAQAKYTLSVIHRNNAINKYGLFAGTNWGAQESKILTAATVDASTGAVTERFNVLGDGTIQFGTYTASTVTHSGYVQIMDIGGTIRKVMIGT